MKYRALVNVCGIKPGTEFDVFTYKSLAERHVTNPVNISRIILKTCLVLCPVLLGILFIPFFMGFSLPKIMMMILFVSLSATMIIPVILFPIYQNLVYRMNLVLDAFSDSDLLMQTLEERVSDGELVFVQSNNEKQI